MIRLVVFDFDGVLADSFDSLYAFNKAAFLFIGKNLTKRRYKDFFKGNIHLGFRKCVKDDKSYKDFLRFRKENFGIFYSKVKLFPGTKEFLNQIDGKYKLAIASSTQTEFISKLLRSSGIKEKFSIITGAGDYTKEKMLKTIGARLKVPSGNTVMISDTVGDIYVAKKIGFKTIGVTWGFHSSSSLKKTKPDVLACNFSELALNLERISRML